MDGFLHPALDMTPREAFKMGIARSGVCIHRLISEYHLQFKGHSERELLLATAEMRKRLDNQSKELSRLLCLVLKGHAGEAHSPALNQFKWGDYYQRALTLLQEPLVECTVDYGKPVPRLTRAAREREPFPSRGPIDTAASHPAFERALKHRKPHAILIDEAEHIAKAARGSKLLDQLDHVKSLAIMSKTDHVLVGTYGLLVFRNLSAQLSRHSMDIQHWKYCYERTIGCVGVLKDWLARALAEAMEKGEKTLSRALLEQHALSVDRCDQMITEAMAGEAALTEDDNPVYRLRVRLGLEPGPAQQPEQQENRTNYGAQRTLCLLQAPNYGVGRTSGSPGM